MTLFYEWGSYGRCKQEGAVWHAALLGEQRPGRLEILGAGREFLL